MVGLLAYRTPFVPFGCETPRPLPKIFSFLDPGFEAVLESRLFAELPLRSFLFGSAWERHSFRSYPVRRRMARCPRPEAFFEVLPTYVDAVCLTMFSALGLMDLQAPGLHVYLGYEDLHRWDRAELLGLVELSPEGEGTASAIDEEVARAHGLGEEDFNAYLARAERGRAQLAGSPEGRRYTLPLRLGSGAHWEDVPVRHYPTKRRGQSRVDFARWASGASVVFATSDASQVASFGGVRVRGSGVASGHGQKPGIEYLTRAVNKALRAAGVALRDIDLFELFDGRLTLTLALQRALGISVERTNVSGNAAVYGDTLSAAGGLLLTNVQSQFARDSGCRRALLVLYTFSMATALVVDRPE